MREKWIRAIALLDTGLVNQEINTTLRAEFGSGVGPSKLAEWRAEKPARVAAQLKTGKQATREAKLALSRQMLAAGESGYACNQACKAEFGSGLGHDTLTEIQAELKAGAQGAATPTPKGAIRQVELPPEMLEMDPPEQVEVAEPALIEVAPVPIRIVVEAPVPNGTLVNMKALQQWMISINADKLSLTRDGKVSVRVHHEFNLGAVL